MPVTPNTFVGSPAYAPELLPAPPSPPCLADRLLRDISVFTNPCGWGVALMLWPQGKEADAVSFNGIWDEDGLSGDNQVTGDGRAIDHRAKRADRKSIIIECSVDHPTAIAARLAGMTPSPALKWFQDPQDPSRPDIVVRVRDGLKAVCKRIVGSDDAMLSMLAIKMDIVRTQQGVVTG